MKRSWRGVILLSLVLLLNIWFTQKVVHMFFYEKNELVLLYCGLNIILFPIAYLIYRFERNKV